jgi:hypothetical protein
VKNYTKTVELRNLVKVLYKAKYEQKHKISNIRQRIGEDKVRQLLWELFK